MKRKNYLALFGVLAGFGLSAQISTFPHFTNFESEALCGTSCTGACNPAGDWKNADQYGFPQAGTDWLAEDGSTPSSTTGPDLDHTLGSSTGKYMYVETSGCNSVSAHLVSAIYNFSAVSAPKISFWYHMYGATMGTMHLDVDTTGLGNWVNDVVPAWTDNQNIWQLRDISLVSYANRPSVRIRIRATTGTSFTSDMAVDDINVYEPFPTDLDVNLVSAGGGCGNSITTPVILTLINNGTNSIPPGTLIPVAFDINNTVVLDTIITSTLILTNDTFTFTFTNGFADLSGPNTILITAWSAWAADLATGNDTTTASAIGIPIISTYPYMQDFETGQNGWVINNGTTGTWAFGTPAKTTIIGASSGVNAFVTGGLGTGFYLDNDVSYIEGPCFDFSNICDPVLSMRVWWNAEFSWDGMNVTISTDGGNTWTLVGAFGDPLNWYTDNTIVGNPGGFQSGWSGRASTTNGSGGWVTARHRLTGAGNTANVKIRINYGSDGSVTDDGVAFDDIQIFNGTDLGADQTICSPASISLNADHGNGSATYLWSTGATTSTITAASTGWYSVAIAADVNCTTTDSIYLAVVDSLTVIGLGSDTSTCAMPYMLDAGYWPGSVYSWSNGDSTQTITAASSGTYIAIVTTPCGTLRDTIVVNVNPLPVVDLGIDSVFCGSATLSAGSGLDTYLWSTGATTVLLTATTSGIYSVNVINPQGCLNADTIAVVVNSLPAVTLGTDVMQCGGTVTLDAGVFNSYLWSNGDSTQQSTVSTSGAYSVMVSDSNGCINADTAMVTIYTLPVVNLGADSTFCGGTVTLDAGIFVSYAWSNGDSTQTTTVNSSGTYSVMATDSNGCMNNDSIQLTFLGLPAVSLGADVTQCGGSVTLDAGMFVSYVWSNGDSTQQSTVSTTGSYTVMVSDSNGCSNSDTVMVTVNTPPVATLALPFSTVCVDDGAYTLSGGSPAGGIYGGTGVSGSLFSPSAAGIGTHSIMYMITDSAGCSDTTSQVVTVNACVGIPDVFANNQVSVYPNPSAGLFTVELRGATNTAITLTVLDSRGRSLLEKQANAAGSDLRTTLDLSSFDNGFYFLVMQSGNTSKTVKLVVNR